MSHLSLALMLSILANGVLFYHSHELDNGKIITHAHPILCSDLGDIDDHGHTEKELFILDLLAHADYFVCDFSIEIPELIIQDADKASLFISHIFFSEVAVGFDLRGPPFIA
ncbi:hypothetical protein [Cecembia sp.]|uniref:hypothetical protein n=1 Tax=Cecembia sp. TaxID=1898110 RepID=UPI0025BB54AA|nr:hypothetical protein [Cecembia sp.]